MSDCHFQRMPPRMTKKPGWWPTPRKSRSTEAATASLSVEDPMKLLVTTKKVPCCHCPWFKFNGSMNMYPGITPIALAVSKVSDARTPTRNHWHTTPCQQKLYLDCVAMGFNEFDMLQFLVPQIKVSELFHEFNVSAMLDLSCCHLVLKSSLVNGILWHWGFTI